MTAAQANRVRFPPGSLSDFRMWESCWPMPLVGGFSWGLRFPHPFIPTLLHTHLISPASALKTSMLTHSIKCVSFRSSVRIRHRGTLALARRGGEIMPRSTITWPVIKWVGKLLRKWVSCGAGLRALSWLRALKKCTEVVTSSKDYFNSNEGHECIPECHLSPRPRATSS
ncbi:hypothetical protein PR048_006318 [Dryococelus australis]|uniref:Uncharacterized protein n=1 Tax=Dryococelus australis TaxID=614101 RepID=A0ABQ9IAM2_9NEOP|nr:hypothetical protein PR048_006318 [Dryococelus australis]